MNKVIVLVSVMLFCNVYPEKQPSIVENNPEKQPQVDLAVFWDSCREYILGPIVTNMVDKKVKDMGIGNLSHVLEEKISAVMGEFIKLGNQAKQLSGDKANKDAIQKIHAQMAELFHQLRPAEATVRGMYPKMIKLFDQINKLYPDQYTQLDYVIDETMFNTIQEAVTEKEKSRWLWN